MWTGITRANYDRSDLRYASDVTNAEPESSPTAKCATVFGQLEVLSGESRISETDAANLTLNKIDEFHRLFRRSNAFPEFETYPMAAKNGNQGAVDYNTRSISAC